MTTYIFGLIIAALCSTSARAYDVTWDGNHPAAASEAWTWMGHLNHVVKKDGVDVLGDTGMGYIFYYTRSVERTMGTMTFRSSALTSTLNGVGTGFKTDTIYASQHDGALTVREGRLDLTFTGGGADDRARTMIMTPSDHELLARTLKFFPGLKITPGFTPKKTKYHEVERDGTVVDLSYYAIWPVLSAPEGKIRFLGQNDTMSFTEPMLITTGTVGGKKMVGLSFLDRQWAANSFGDSVMDGLGDLLRYGHAFNYAHNWSAFHARNLRTGEYSFFHLWHQWHRQDNVRDQLDDYSGLLYVRNNGTESAMLDRDDYTWRPSGYVLQKGRQIIMNFAKGRDGFFNSRADFNSDKLKMSIQLYATPALQNLNQPIPFFEGFASGPGTFEGDPIVVEGRLESSRVMFRDVDYQEMLENMTIAGKSDPAWAQEDVAQYLKAKLAYSAATSAKPALGPFVWVDQQVTVASALLGGIAVKLSLVKAILSGQKAKPDPKDQSVIVYH